MGEVYFPCISPEGDGDLILPQGEGVRERHRVTGRHRGGSDCHGVCLSLGPELLFLCVCAVPSHSDLVQA